MEILKEERLKGMEIMKEERLRVDAKHRDIMKEERLRLDAKHKEMMGKEKEIITNGILSIIRDWVHQPQMKPRIILEI